MKKKKRTPRVPSIPGDLGFGAREHIEGVGTASCYYCLKSYKADTIKEWIDGGLTAICPRCQIDSVVAGRVKKSVLQRWHHESFCKCYGWNGKTKKFCKNPVWHCRCGLKKKEDVPYVLP